MTGDVHVAGLQSSVPPVAKAGSAVSITLRVAAKSVIVFSVVDALVLIAPTSGEFLESRMYTTRAKVVPHLDYGNVAVVDQHGFGVEALDGQAARPVRASYRGDSSVFVQSCGAGSPVSNLVSASRAACWTACHGSVPIRFRRAR
jgi:hypothetical protein